MLLLSSFALAFASLQYVAAKSVFAHFMVTNTQNYTAATWSQEIALAQQAHIQAFALNMAYGDPANPGGVAAAFKAASGTGFQLFFSFDYAGQGPWPKDVVTQYISQYSSNGAYYHYKGQPFVSTFEGPDQADDWTDIKSATGCFFVPSWSSKGAKAALQLDNGVADGLFSWAGWAWGDLAMNTYVDASYLQYLSGKPYMMPVSPWFYTNLPGYNKNWLWRGDDAWFDRWNQVLYLQPEWVEIQTWNDYGESHYIGPLREEAFAAFDIGRSPFNYARNMPHDAWRAMLPYSIDLYLNNVSTITTEQLVVWFRPNPAGACNDGGTTGNTASQLQIEFTPSSVLQDRIYFSVLAASLPKSLTVTIGGTQLPAQWTDEPDGGIGIYHGSSQPFSSLSGQVVVTVVTAAGTMSMQGSQPITTSCNNGYNNFNAWTGLATGGSVHATPARLDTAVCVEGNGVPSFASLCEFSCEFGYCPIGACNCVALGKQKQKMKPTNIMAYPVATLDASYSGLCAYDCANGFCPPTKCTTTSATLPIATVSDFLPPACIAGTDAGNGALTGLCSFGCSHGFCPIHACKCTGQGGLNDLQPFVGTTGFPLSGEDYGLCNFACQRGYCPPGSCGQTLSGPQGPNGPSVFIPPDIWNDNQPSAGCQAPCIVVLPPKPLGSTTVIQFPPVTTTLLSVDQGTSSTVTTVIEIPPLTTTAIPFWPITISGRPTTSLTITPVQSVLPPSVTVTLNDGECTFPPSHAGSSATAAPTCTSGGNIIPIQPFPVFPVPVPGGFIPPPLPLDPLAQNPTCTAGCGAAAAAACALFGCDGGCGTFGCDGGCGIFGCGGGCGAGGCTAKCSLDTCGPLECVDGGCDPGASADEDSSSIAGALCPAGKRSLLVAREINSLSTDPLKSAMGFFGRDTQGNLLASSALDSLDQLLMNIFPKGEENSYPTGLQGRWTIPTNIQNRALRIGGQTFRAGQQVRVNIRWDFEPPTEDEVKNKYIELRRGPHVNFGIDDEAGTRANFGITLALDLDPDATVAANFKIQEAAMAKIDYGLRKSVGGYNTKLNMGRKAEDIYWPKDQTRDQVRDRLRNYFKSQLNDAC